MNIECPPAPGLWGLPSIPLHAATPTRRAPAATDEADEAAPLQVAILHDDLAAGEQATQALAALARDFAAEVVVHPSFWSFAMLEQPWGRLAAVTDAGAADLLIVSTRSSTPLPGAVLNWIAHWAELKQGTSAALLLLFGRPGNFDSADSDRVRFLQGLATGAGLELFTPRPGGVAAEPHPLCEHLHEREVTLTPTLRDALRRQPCALAMN